MRNIKEIIGILFVSTLMTLLFNYNQIPACDPTPEQEEQICSTEILIHFQDQHVNGCHVAPHFILENVTSDSLILTAKSVVIQNSNLNKLEIRDLNCN